MAAYKPTMSYRLIYIFTIHDAQHEGYWKIGKTNFDSVNSYKQLPPNCAELNCAARDRIDQYTKTAMVEYDLQYTELARRTVTFPDGTTDTELFDDDDVHNVLYNSGFSARKFSNSNQDSEWFEVPLSVAIRAIQAVKEGRTALTAAERVRGRSAFCRRLSLLRPKREPLPCGMSRWTASIRRCGCSARKTRCSGTARCVSAKRSRPMRSSKKLATRR